ncbi:hypothetical protein EU803_17270 [Loktanella sp. IMCC34160]|uniref:hypothetical protein n=1 Tax=Loktanella sp. IMCC34160 TaxID=2510646 RepID=UPI00101D03F4|nr:hypothetical protein [Loktanella sp. IMCC34160]RYG89481.1 hypothetical protein EU803_17270 [Loktanella sp. IMCC34160]
MDTDLYFVIGLIVAGFSIPPIFGALSEGRAPRAAAIAILIGGGLVALAVNERPGTYSISEIPDAFVRVVGRYIN